MTPTRRWLADPKTLPRELQQALESDGAEPGAEQLRHLTEQLAQSLGVMLTPPPPVSGVETVAAAKLSASVTISAAKPLVVLGAWVLGGVVLGAGLSGLAQLALPTDGPAPRARAGSLPSVQVARHVPVESSPEAARTALVDPPRLSATIATSEVASARSTASAAVEPSAPAETEVELLKRAQLALGINAGLALELTRTHEVRFEQPRLDQEREMIAIHALMRLGRLDEARRRGQAFRARYPRSAHLHRLEGLLEK